MDLGDKVNEEQLELGGANVQNQKGQTYHSADGKNKLTEKDRLIAGTDEAVTVSGLSGEPSTNGNPGKGSDILDDFKICKPFLLRCVMTSAFGSLLLGYDLGIISGAIIPLRQHFGLSNNQVGFLVSCIIFASCVGSLVAGSLADKIGRRYSLLLASGVFCMGALLMGLSNSYAELVVWRCITGVGVGIGMVICPIYVAELSPRRHRGGTTSFHEIMISTGIPIAYLVGFLFRGKVKGDWRYMLASGSVLAVGLFVMTLILPESPFWLVKWGGSGGRLAAEKVVKRLVAPEESAERSKRAVTAMMEEIDNDNRDAHQTAALDETKSANASASASGWGSWKSVLEPANRRPLCIGLMFAVLQQFMGTDSLVFFSVFTLTHYGGVTESTALAITLSLGIVKLVFTCITASLFDKQAVGRRMPLYVGGVGIIIATLTIAFAGLDRTSSGSSGGIIFGYFLFMAAFGASYGPLCWLLLTELFTGRYRSKSLAVGSMCNRLASALTTVTFLPMISTFTFSGTFFIYASVCVFNLWFSFHYIPDLTNQSMGIQQK